MQLLGLRYYLPKIGRFLTQDPIGQAGGLNLYAYCENNPLTRVDPTGLTDYDASFVHGQIRLWQADGLLAAAKNHAGGGDYDYKNNKFWGDRFRVHGIWLNAPEFGNYAAGYAGYYSGKGIGLGGVQFFGHVYEAMEGNNRGDNEVGFWGNDGEIDKQLIMLGATDAYMDLKAAGKDHRPFLGWQRYPSTNKWDSLQYIRSFNMKQFGSVDANAVTPAQARRSIR